MSESKEKRKVQVNKEEKEEREVVRVGIKRIGKKELLGKQ